ncbi:hypothetical protein CITRIK5_10120 [Citricoccus sp. K5]|nr:hypothetical protein CITRIK5_10120 [Citricoccus sp. K5]
MRRPPPAPGPSTGRVLSVSLAELHFLTNTGQLPPYALGFSPFARTTWVVLPMAATHQGL